MSHLAIYLFGGFRAELDGHSLLHFPTDKTRALLAYLAVESGITHRREALASLLWCEHSEALARNSLRQALFHLRQILDPETVPQPHLVLTPNQVQLNLAGDLWIDVLEFKQRLAACKSNHPGGQSLCAGCLESLQKAIDLYQGDLLDGLTLPHCEPFTEWQILSQEACYNQALAACSWLVNSFAARLEYEKLIDATQKLIALEPWSESGYQLKIWALAMTGQREAALHQYQVLEKVLQREMGIRPSDSLRRMVGEILKGELLGPVAGKGHAPAATRPASPVDCGESCAKVQPGPEKKQPIYCETREGIFRFRVSGIALRDGKVLLQRLAGRPAYTFPGGDVIFGEDSREALARVFKEKIGADIQALRMAWMGESFFSLEQKSCHQVCFYYKVKLCGEVHLPTGVRLDGQGLVKFEWMPIAELGNLGLLPDGAQEKWVDLPEGIENRVCRLDGEDPGTLSTQA